MCSSDLLAASTKTRGRGIGFAGVGIKLGLIVCEEVVTETRRGKSHVATSWRLSSRHRAPWRWTDPAGLVTERGTAVQLRLSNALSPLLDVGFVESTVKGHFAPLLDSTFTEILSPFYRHGIRFLVNGEEVKPPTPRAVLDRMPIVIRLARKRRPSAVGYLERGDAPLPVEQQVKFGILHLVRDRTDPTVFKQVEPNPRLRAGFRRRARP